MFPLCSLRQQGGTQFDGQLAGKLKSLWRDLGMASCLLTIVLVNERTNGHFSWDEDLERDDEEATSTQVKISFFFPRRYNILLLLMLVVVMVMLFFLVHICSGCVPIHLRKGFLVVCLFVPPGFVLLR